MRSAWDGICDSEVGGVSKWQPIETAPKDGTKIDIWAKERFVPNAPVEPKSYRMTNAYWISDNFGNGPCWVYDCECSPQGIEILLQGGARIITHWMPLPEPPK